MRELGINIVRAGGYNNDSQHCRTFEPFSKEQIDIFVKYCRDVGAEPILQVPILRNLQDKPATAQDAADLVNYCNIIKKYNIKYWSIGNEPDCYAGRDKSSYTVDDFCRDFHNFSQAMKAVDPTIKILGPDLSWKYYPKTGNDDWLTPFLKKCGSDIDIMAIHRYPFTAEQCTINNAMNDNSTFREWLRQIRTVMNSQGLGSIPIAITEANISWDPDPAHMIYPASPTTYYAGIWIADNMGVALEENVWNVSYWDLCEEWDLSFLDPQTKKPRHNYYGLQMITAHVGAKILPTIKTLPKGFSVYASRNADDDRTILIVINKNKTAGHEIIKFKDFAKNLVPREYDFPEYSITCLSIPDDGSAMQIWRYTKELASKRLPPEQIQ
jgi:hypothetical protein